MKEYEIWIEGYVISGGSSKASFIGKCEGKDFENACNNFVYPEDIIGYVGFEQKPEVFIEKGSKLRLDKDGLSIWGCRLFDNQTDARKSFG